MRWLCLLLLGAVSLRADQAGDFKHWLISYEGCIHHPVVRSREVTVGVGHNLLGDHQPIKQWYTDAEIQAYYQTDYAAALRVARYEVFDFDYLPQGVRYVCQSLIWTCGKKGFTDFHMFIAFIDLRDYRDAATELRHSKWASQVGRRRLNEHIQTLISQ